MKGMQTMAVGVQGGGLEAITFAKQHRLTKL